MIGYGATRLHMGTSNGLQVRPTSGNGTKGAAMKTVFTNRELPHIWAHQSQPSGRGHNFYFNGPTIYSYGGHFPIARHVTNGKGERAILFTTHDYSVSTQRHKSYVRHACHGQRVFLVPLAPGNVAHTLAACRAEFLDDYAQRINTLGLAVGRSRKYADSELTRLTALVDEANAFARFVGSRRTFTVPNLDTLREHAKHAIVRERQRKAKAQAWLQKVHAEAIAAWRAGTRPTLPWEITRTYLRTTDNGENVETSKGAKFPIEHARRGFALVESVRETGEPYQRNEHTHTLHLGPYVIDKIDKDGNVSAGCHYVEYAEIERLRPQLEGGAS